MRQLSMSSNYSALVGVGLVVAANAFVFYNQIDAKPLVVQDWSFETIFSSAFSHTNEKHLFDNMMTLIIYGWMLHNSSSRIWRSIWTFAFIYFGAVIAGALADIYTVQRMQAKLAEMKQKDFDDVMNNWGCTTYLCSLVAWNSFVEWFAKRFNDLAHLKSESAILLAKRTSRIGASGGVFGMMSAYSVCSFFSRHHRIFSFEHLNRGWLSFLIACFSVVRSIDLIKLLLQELSWLSLDMPGFIKAVWESDGMGHICHGGGVAFGLIAAVCLCLLEHVFP